MLGFDLFKLDSAINIGLYVISEDCFFKLQKTMKFGKILECDTGWMQTLTSFLVRHEMSDNSLDQKTHRDTLR